MPSDARECHVYWIHLPTHTCIADQGYVGVTLKPPKHRYSEHKFKANTGASLPLSRAIRKYGEALVVTTLVVGPEDYCYLVEGRLRPESGIGWNVAIGGGVSSTTGRHHTSETKAKLSKANSGRRLSDEVKARISAGQTGRKQSEATKAKIAAARTGKVHSAETRIKMSNARTGKVKVKE